MEVSVMGFGASPLGGIFRVWQQLLLFKSANEDEHKSLDGVASLVEGIDWLPFG